ncbi:MAG: putative sulfate transporter [Chlamydiia bacterium]|nr:putative sulfate transporter [Chlamydiia bacterium]
MSFLNQVSKFFKDGSFTPKTFVCLREGYSQKAFFQDLLAGITVGVIALPLAMALGIGSGVTPERGLFTAIIAGFLISFLGGSRVQIGGPTGAYVVIVYDVVARHGYEGLAIATLLAACILIILGLTKCGTYIRFIPYPVTTGFTTGIATSMFINQVKDICGLQIPKVSIECLERLHQYWEFKSTFNPWSIAITAVALTIIVIFRKISRKIPGAIIAVIITAFFVFFFNIPVDTIEKKFGSIPNMLPVPTFPSISLENIQRMFPDAIAIALLGAIESLLSCVVADGMTGFRHKSNLELVAQGVANFGSVIFGGIPATGAVARTTANVQLGAKTPISGMIHAVTILLLMLLLAPLAVKIPLASLSALLVFVAYNMAEFDHFKDILKGPKSESLILLTTFSLTVLIDLTVAVQAGVLIAAFLFLKHMTEKTTLRACKLLEAEEAIKENPSTFPSHIPSGVEIFEIDGPFFFSVSDILNDALRRLPKNPKVFILRLPKVPLIDGSGMQALKVFHKK